MGRIGVGVHVADTRSVYGLAFADGTRLWACSPPSVLAPGTPRRRTG